MLTELTDTIAGLVSLLEGMLVSPFAGAVILLVVALDAFLPVVPSETLVVAAGALAASGAGPAPVVTVLVAAVGAVTGDLVAYRIGSRLGRRVQAGEAGEAGGARAGRRARVLRTAQRQLDERGPGMVVAARFVPGGRTAVTTACGALGMPLRRFVPLAAVAGLLWATWGVLLGLLGGAALQGNPAGGVVLGCGLAMSVTLVAEVVRFVRRRRRSAEEPAGELLEA